MKRKLIIEPEWVVFIGTTLERTLSLAAVTQVFFIGKAIGSHLANETKTSENAFKKLEEYKWGKAEVVKKNKEIIIRWENSPVCEVIKKNEGRSAGPTCHILRGVIVGIFLELLKKNFTCIERKCVSKGDEFCEFVVKSTE